MNKVDVKIVTTRKQYLKWLFRPTFKREKQFRNSVISIKKKINLELILINQFTLGQAS